VLKRRMKWSRRGIERGSEKFLNMIIIKRKKG
jgi:hypothetical protein